MSNPQKRARQLVLESYNKDCRDRCAPSSQIKLNQVFLVWFTKTLGNWKAMIGIDDEQVGVYYEVTYNGEKKETYVDLYEKISNTVVPDDGALVILEVRKQGSKVRGRAVQFTRARMGYGVNPYKDFLKSVEGDQLRVLVYEGDWFVRMDDGALDIVKDAEFLEKFTTIKGA